MGCPGEADPAQQELRAESSRGGQGSCSEPAHPSPGCTALPWAAPWDVTALGPTGLGQGLSAVPPLRRGQGDAAHPCTRLQLQHDSFALSLWISHKNAVMLCPSPSPDRKSVSFLFPDNLWCSSRALGLGAFTEAAGLRNLCAENWSHKCGNSSPGSRWEGAASSCQPSAVRGMCSRY